ncbi:MAG: SUMF1/EgtB/PvdO family nonheme iron enzyme [Saprospiraceae bacterium]|nr:SUMF1/EgtB/PvdO family nonheme iron enzyme [Saprospiraceae bacterium]
MSTPEKSYRYPGVQPFSSDQQRIFFGRQDDTQRLLSLMLQERLCVLFGKSGHGKSSLLNAGIIPALAEKGKKGNRRYVPVTVRFNTWTPQDTQTLYDKFVFHLGKAMADAGMTGVAGKTGTAGMAKDETRKFASLPNSLWGIMKKWNIAEGTGIVLLFDQFEEFFSYPQEQQSAFKEQLAELLYVDYPQFLEDNEDRLDPEYAAFLAEKTDVRALLSIRADRLSDLDRLKDRLPAILHKRYELRALDTEQARQAVVGPAGEPGDGYRSPAFAYDEAALLTILRELTGREGAEAGRIEAFLLQIVCASIEKRVTERGLATVREPDLPDFDTVFDDYYQDRIGELPQSERAPARRVLEQGLLLVDPQSGEGRRLSRDAGELAQAFQVSPALLENLERTYLLRREVNSLGSFSYELSHDTLIGPVLKARKAQEAVEEAERLEQERIDAETRAREAEEKAAEEKRKAEEAERLKNEAIRARRRATWFAWVTFSVSIVAIIAFYKARTALRDQQAALKVVGWMTLMEADTFIKKMDYESAYLYLNSATMITAISEEVSNALLEMAFFYAETNQLERAWGVLDTAYQIINRDLVIKNGDRLAAREAIRHLNPQRDSFLQARYFPVMIDIQGRTDTIGSGNGNEKFFVVTLSDYQLAESEITWWQYNLYCAATGTAPPEKPGWGGEGDNPVVNVSWYNAVAYAGWLSDREGLPQAVNCRDEDNCSLDLQAKSYRLPTEAEWEFAARGGTNITYAGCDQESDLPDFAWYFKNSGSRTRPVKTRRPNIMGLYDMSGNVWEWCWDWHGGYPTEAKVNPIGPEMGPYRVLRGGAWHNNAVVCRVANRPVVYSDDLYGSYGFRLARTL